MHTFYSRFFSRFPRKSLLGQFFRYLVTGGFAFVMDLGLFALCLYVFGWHYLLANLIGLVAGLVLNYALSIVWVFTACKRTFEKRKFAEFFYSLSLELQGLASTNCSYT